MIRRRQRLVVVGNGMAGERFVDELLAGDRTERWDVTVIGEEHCLPYDRTLLPRVLAGAKPASIVSKAPGWYADRGVTLLSGRWVQRLDTERRVAHIGNGETVAYDTAVLATGSAPTLPKIFGVTSPDGTRTEGVHVFRSLDDCLALRSRTWAGTPVRDVAVVGAGLLGVEVARTLAARGHRVTVVHPLEAVLKPQVDAIGATLRRSSVEAFGIRFVIGFADALLVGRRVEAVALDDGRTVPADDVVFLTPSRPTVPARRCVAHRVPEGGRGGRPAPDLGPGGVRGRRVRGAPPRLLWASVAVPRAGDGARLGAGGGRSRRRIPGASPEAAGDDALGPSWMGWAAGSDDVAFRAAILE